MTDHKSIAAALAAAQSEMKPPEKNAENPAFKRDGKPMKYADLTSVVESVRAPLTKHGICWGWRSVEFMNGLAMECYLKHGASDTELACAVPMHLDRQNMHGLKSAYTYAKRIGLESLTGQAPADDDDGNAASEHMAKAAPAPRQQPKPAPDHSEAMAYLQAADTLDELKRRWDNLPEADKTIPVLIRATNARKAALTPKEPEQSPITDDHIPYEGK